MCNLVKIKINPPETFFSNTMLAVVVSPPLYGSRRGTYQTKPGEARMFFFNRSSHSQYYWRRPEVKPEDWNTWKSLLFVSTVSLNEKNLNSNVRFFATASQSGLFQKRVSLCRHLVGRFHITGPSASLLLWFVNETHSKYCNNSILSTLKSSMWH